MGFNSVFKGLIFL